MRFEPVRVSVSDVPPPGVPARAEPLQGKATTRVIFSDPGTYQLRAYGDDGILTTPLDVTVEVSPQNKPGRQGQTVRLDDHFESLMLTILV